MERNCRSCGAALQDVFVDLGLSPPSEDFLVAERLLEPETFYPLDVWICRRCLLVQLPAYISPEKIFTEYAYFSSYSTSWVEHARRYVDAMIQRFDIGPSSRVVEIASNDGYLLQHVIARGIPALGVEPARNIAEVARAHGIDTVNEFFSHELAERLVASGGPADLLVANDVFAHIPDLEGFSAGLRTLLAPRGVLTIEVAHLVRLIEGNEFDTIYHEHFMYWTLHSAERALARHELRVFDVEELPTHGGSLRFYVCHDRDPRETHPRVVGLRERERAGGYDTVAGYAGFSARVEATKRELLRFLIDARQRGASVVGYGAPGKANTLLNYCGIRTDLIEYLVDRNPYKHGRYTPGTRIPIHPPSRLEATRPDYIVVLPWNLRDEIERQLRPLCREIGARLVYPIPELTVIEP